MAILIIKAAKEVVRQSSIKGEKAEVGGRKRQAQQAAVYVYSKRKGQL